MLRQAVIRPNTAYIDPCFIYKAYKPSINLSIPVIYYDERFLYVNLPFAHGFLVSNYGRVYNSNTGFLIKRSTSGNEYIQVKINGYSCLVHRVVMQTFQPILNPDDFQVNHKDGNKYNNRLYNLEWATSSQNMLHVYTMNLQVQGEDHPWAKLTEYQLSIICQALEARLSYRAIANILGLEYNSELSATLTSIRNERNWKSVSKNYNIPEADWNKQIFTNPEIRQICEYLEQGLNTNQILLNMGVKLEGNGKYEDNSNIYEIIGKIRRRTTFAEISKDYNF